MTDNTPAAQSTTVDDTALRDAIKAALALAAVNGRLPSTREPLPFASLAAFAAAAVQPVLAAKDAVIEQVRAELRFERDAAKSLARDLRVQWQASEERERVVRREVKELRGTGDRAAEMVSLLKDLVDPDDCQFDHHGGCQAHGYLSLELDEQCPVQEAKDLIESWRPATEAAEAPDQAETTRRWRDAEGHVWTEMEPGQLTGRGMVDVPYIDVSQGYGLLTALPALPSLPATPATEPAEATDRQPQAVTLPDMLAEFHAGFGQTFGDGGSGSNYLRLWLYKEERDELIEALKAGDLVGIAHELADVVYISYGTAHSLGIPLDAVVAEVHRANMSKTDDNGRFVLRADGKVLKTNQYRAPDVAGVLKRATEPASPPATDYPSGLPERVAKSGCEATTWDRCLLKECDCGGYTAEPRVFRKGDPEPDSSVEAVRHTNSQVFTRRPWPFTDIPARSTWLWQSGPGGFPRSWKQLTDHLGGYTLTAVPAAPWSKTPLTEVCAEGGVTDE